MSIRHRKSGTYVTTLRDFGGLDLSSEHAGTTPRFSRLDNMWRDYRAGEGDALESFPGFRVLTRLDGAIHGIWRWRSSRFDRLLVHAGDSLYWGDYSHTDGASLTSPLSLVLGGEGTLADHTSVGFAFEDDLYLLDGTQYFHLRGESGVVQLLSAHDRYLPTTYADGAPYEQRNLLSDYVWNRHHIGDPAAYPPASPGLRYRITDRTQHHCVVTGYLSDETPAELFVPRETLIGGIPYTVTGIAPFAFHEDPHLTQVYLAEGILEVGIHAFSACPHLERVFLADSVTTLREAACQDCPSLVALILGTSLGYVGARVLEDSTEASVFYRGDEEQFAAISVADENDAFLAAPRTYSEESPAQHLRFPFHEDVQEVVDVLLEGVTLSTIPSSRPYYAVDYTDDGRPSGVILYASGSYSLMEQELRIKLRLRDTAFGSVAGETDVSASSGYDGLTYAALAHCTLATVFDGRIFFSGNPALPTTVFYTTRDLSGRMNPLYVGVYNYFHAGDGVSPVTALLPTGDYLAVLTGIGDTGELTYYRGEDTNRDLVPRIYVIADRLRGGNCTGVACLVRDDPVFLTPEGLTAISRAALNTERSLKHRSTFIDAALLAQDTGTALSAVWEGYLVLLFPDGEAFLADSRRMASTDRGTEYEWYHLTQVGCYSDDLPVYRYADGYYDTEPDSILFGGQETALALHADADALPFGCDYESYPARYGEILSGVNTRGERIAYTVEGTASHPCLYLLRRTHERTGGTFSPPTALAGLGDKLFFGCENGCLAVVNTDQRGVMTPMQALVYEPAAYARQWGRLINPEWYAYAGHRYPAGLATLPDDGGVTNYTKGTLRGTTVLEMKAGVGLGFSIEVRLWRTSGPEAKTALHTEQGGIDFTSLNFGSLNFGACEDCTVTLNERSRRYLRKQYCLFSDAYARPFGLTSLSYTWQIEGRVKNL